MRGCFVLGVTLTACTFTTRVDEEPPLPNAAIVDDTAEDFAAHAQLVDGVVTPWGRIEPDAFVLGGLHAVAYPNNRVMPGDTFEDVAARLAAEPALGAAYRQVPVDWGNSARPAGLGLTANNNYTVLYAGEVLLPRGAVVLEVEADTRGVVEVALDGAVFDRRVSAAGAATLALVVPRDGWYPIRAALGQMGGTAKLVLRHTLGGVTTAIDGDRLRARVTDHHGVIAFAYNGALFEPRGETARPTLADDFGTDAPPFDLPVPADEFALRYAGQLRIDTAADYTFTVAADDGWRLWIDGELVGYRWNVPLSTQPVAPLRLEPGWHDIALDYVDVLGAANVELRMEGGGVPAGPIEPARLRPAIAHGLISASFDPTPRPIGDNTITVIDLDLGGAPQNAIIESIDYLFGIVEQRMTDLTATLYDCTGAHLLPLDADPGTFYFGADRTCAGRPVHAPVRWRLHLADSVPGNEPVSGTPALQNLGVAVSYRGGPRMPFAPELTYVSAPKPTPGAIRLGALTVTGDLDGALLQLAVRTADDEAALDDAPWIVVANGGNPQVPARAFLQYKLVLATNGWRYATIDRVELAYFTTEP